MTPPVFDDVFYLGMYARWMVSTRRRLRDDLHSPFTFVLKPFSAGFSSLNCIAKNATNPIFKKSVWRDARMAISGLVKAQPARFGTTEAARARCPKLAISRIGPSPNLFSEQSQFFPSEIQFSISTGPEKEQRLSARTSFRSYAPYKRLDVVCSTSMLGSSHKKTGKEFRVSRMAKPSSSDRERPTIREVAKLAGVALMTVSRVINNHPSVRPKSRKKVQAAIEELGYERNEAAGLLKGHRSLMIGLILPDLADIFFATCANTVEQLARENGYMTMVVSSGHDAELEMQQAELMARRKLSGLLIVTSGKGDPGRVRKLLASGLAIVAFDRPLEGLGTDAVLVENRSGAEDAIKHLIGHGHKRIACVGYDDDAYPVRERIDGYRNVMLANRLRPVTFMKMHTLDAVLTWLKAISGKADRPTALFSTNYRTTVLLLRALSEQKMKIPSDMALIGFDDFDLAAVIAPPVTTVGQSPVDLAARATRLLMERIQEVRAGAESTPAKILLPATLIVRESCGRHSKQ